MGKRDSFTAFEEMVINLYNRKALDCELLCTIWRVMSSHLDMDSGGYSMVEARDGKLLPTIIVQMVLPDFDIMSYTPEEDYDREAFADIDEPTERRNWLYHQYFWEVLYFIQDWSKLNEL